jgi:predicted NBD/HSP70 family sugar kinase
MTMPMQIGIDIGGSKMLAIARNPDIQARSQLPTGKDFSAVDAQTEIERFIQTLSTPPDSIGIAIPGLVDRSGQVIACDVLPQLVGWQPSIAFSSLTVSVLNDAEAALVQVAIDLKPQTVAAVVMVGTGIGAAIYVNGKILRGANGWAGELGSIPLGDGKTLDDLASGAAILAELGVSSPVTNALVVGGNLTTLKAIERAGTSLGMGLATLINLFNPEAIVVAGGTLRWQGYFAAAIESAQRHSLPDLWAACSLQLSPHDGDLVALGAARSSHVEDIHNS